MISFDVPKKFEYVFFEFPFFQIRIEEQEMNNIFIDSFIHPIDTH